MKNIILIVLMVSGSLFQLSAQNTIKWVTFEEAVKLNKQHPKKFFIDFYTDWCGWCKRLDAVTFVDPDVVKLLNDHYYAIKFDAEGKDTVRFQNRDYIFVQPPESRRGYHVLAAALMSNQLSYPTMVIMSVDSKSEDVTFIQPIKGYIDGEAMEPYLDYFSKDLHIKQVDFNTFKSTFVSASKAAGE
jgi:thioredoxin-related protein